jgi:hypothetical protein
MLVTETITLRITHDDQESPNPPGWDWYTLLDLNGGIDEYVEVVPDDLTSAAPDMLAALVECITDDGAAALANTDSRAVEYARRRLYAINELALAAIARATGGEG